MIYICVSGEQQLFKGFSVSGFPQKALDLRLNYSFVDQTTHRPYH